MLFKVINHALVLEMFMIVVPVLLLEVVDDLRIVVVFFVVCFVFRRQFCNDGVVLRMVLVIFVNSLTGLFKQLMLVVKLSRLLHKPFLLLSKLLRQSTKLLPLLSHLDLHLCILALQLVYQLPLLLILLIDLHKVHLYFLFDTSFILILRAAYLRK